VSHKPGGRLPLLAEGRYYIETAERIEIFLAPKLPLISVALPGFDATRSTGGDSFAAAAVPEHAMLEQLPS